MLRKWIPIRLEHTELTFSVLETAPSQHSPGGALLKFRPDCGATWFPNLRGALVALRLTALHLKAAVSEGRLYLCLAPTNEIWLCERSIQQMKENS